MILVTLPQMFVALVASGITLVSQPLFAKCAINPEYYSSKHATCSAAIRTDGSAIQGRLEPTPHRYSQGDDDHGGHEHERNGAAVQVGSSISSIFAQAFHASQLSETAPWLPQRSRRDSNESSDPERQTTKTSADAPGRPRFGQGRREAEEEWGR